MAKVRDVMAALETIAPQRYAFSFDRVGLQVGDPNASVGRGVVSLDRSLGAVRHAAAEEAQMLVCHHPLIFEPLKSVTATTNAGRTVMQLLAKGIAFAAAHTNWDSAKGGINDALAELLSLSEVESFGTGAEVERLKAVVFCPRNATESIIDAVSEAGAAQIGDYSRCAFITPGTGTFKGGQNTNPTVGNPGEVEHVEEDRVEFVLPIDKAKAVAKAIRASHPYEEPAFDLLRMQLILEQPAGRLAPIEAQSLTDLSKWICERLRTNCQTWGDPSRRIKRLAIVGGAADSEWRNAQRAGADALLTGEVKQHVGLEASEEGFAIIAAGHYATENPGCRALRDRLSEALPEIEWKMYEPEPGFSGRPICF